MLSFLALSHSPTHTYTPVLSLTLNGQTANWTAPRSDEGTFVYDDKIFVGGGYDENYTSYATVDILDPSSGTWTYAKSSTTTASMSDSRGDFGFVEIKSKFYTFGGWSSDDWCSPRTSAEVYDPSTDEWTSLADLQKVKVEVWLDTRLLLKV